MDDLAPELIADTMIDIHGAVSLNDEEQIKVYVLAGGDLEARDKDWLTPLHVAAAGGLPAVVEFLIKHKGRAPLVDLKSKIGHTPLHLACRFGHLPVVLLLLAEGAEINSRDNDDNTPLHKAASNGKSQLCRELVRRGADIDARNTTEYTPLHWACFKGHKGAAEQLLKCGANIDATSSRRATALFVSAYYGQVDVTFLLLAWGADATIANEDGVKPGDTFLPEVAETQRRQTQILFSERLALLMKGYEATRRNMALMYMRSERSDLNLRMSQGEVETLWGKLVKREKELNMSKIGARDLSHAVKAMKAALEQTRQDSKATRDKMASLEVECVEARKRTEEQRERADKAERALKELQERRGVGREQNGGGNGGGMPPTPTSDRDQKVFSTRGSSQTLHRARSQSIGGESKAESKEAMAAATAASRTPSRSALRGHKSFGHGSATTRRRASMSSAYRSSAADGSGSPAVLSSPRAMSITSGTQGATPPVVVPLPVGRIAELASAINTRVAELGPEAVVPLPLPAASGADKRLSPSSSRRQPLVCSQLAGVYTPGRPPRRSFRMSATPSAADRAIGSSSDAPPSPRTSPRRDYPKTPKSEGRQARSRVEKGEGDRVDARSAREAKNGSSPTARTPSSGSASSGREGAQAAGALGDRGAGNTNRAENASAASSSDDAAGRASASNVGPRLAKLSSKDHESSGSGDEWQGSTNSTDSVETVPVSPEGEAR